MAMSMAATAYEAMPAVVAVPPRPVLEAVARSPRCAPGRCRRRTRSSPSIERGDGGVGLGELGDRLAPADGAVVGGQLDEAQVPRARRSRWAPGMRPGSPPSSAMRIRSSFGPSGAGASGPLGRPATDSRNITGDDRNGASRLASRDARERGDAGALGRPAATVVLVTGAARDRPGGRRGVRRLPAHASGPRRRPAVDDVVAGARPATGTSAAACATSRPRRSRRLIGDVVALAGRFDHLAHARRRAAPAQRHRRDHRGRLGLPGRRQPQGVVLPDARRRRPAATTQRRRQHHGVHVAGLDDRRLRRLGRLRRDEGRHRVDDAGHGADLRRRRRPGQHGLARRRRHADDARAA